MSKSLIMFTLFALTGCGGKQDGPQRASVSGVVSLDGQPLQKGVIRFIPDGETKGPKASVPIKEGHFEVHERFGPVVGEHRIEIESTDDGGYALDDEEAIIELRKAGIKKIDVVQVPQIYNTRSELKETVTEDGPNEFQFDLLSKKKR